MAIQNTLMAYLGVCGKPYPAAVEKLLNVLTVNHIKGWLFFCEGAILRMY